jgi:hypothetical protein
MINTIDQWYGRLGNNIQQISNAIFYCMKNGINFYCPPHELINSFSIQFGQDKNISGRFFFYNTSEKDFDIDIQELNLHRRNICLKYIVPNFKFYIKEAYDKDTLVIHLRSGDVYSLNPPNTYVPNPINFYEELIKIFEYAIVVAEDLNNPIIESLSKNNKVIIQNSSLQDDFSALLRAENLVTSGVGTFSVAAALCSRNIKNLFYTNLYLTEHLNPDMLSCHDIKLNLFILNNYIKIGEWNNSEQQNILIKKIRMNNADNI